MTTPHLAGHPAASQQAIVEAILAIGVYMMIGERTMLNVL